ncbi:MAG: isoaspartyl peptidase/L-asparaginase family protein [Bacteroidia bacterium]
MLNKSCIAILNVICFLLVCLLPFNQVISQTKKNTMTENFKPVIAIHGGAGTILKQHMTAEKEKAYQEKLNEALMTGYSILENGGTALDAVEAAIKIMEDSPLFNAGKGSVFTNAETIEMDAAIMDGSNLKAGAIAGVKTIKNPIVAARAVMEKSEHVFLIGNGAEQFAAKQGIETVSPEYFKDENRLQQLRKIKEQEKSILDHDGEKGEINSEIEFNPEIDKDKKYGTVGAVALDKYGNLAAATSTGGMTNKRYGRVGDAPIIGAGTYANNATCAVSCTGHGEYFIRNVVAYDVSALMEYKGLSLQKAAEWVVNEKLEKQDARGGLIAVDRKGNIAMPFNTPGMYRASVDANGKKIIKIYKD